MSDVRTRAMAGMLAVVVMQGCGGSGQVASPAAPPATSATADLEALYRAREDSALARYTKADADFMRGMIDHHAQALAMAALAESHGASRQVSTLAERVTIGQEAEIQLMRQWLQDRGVPAVDPDAAAGHSIEVPGMLTPDQMRELGDAKGRDFDRLFLSGMIQHHTGAVTMVERLFATPGAARHPSTFRIASGIQVDQRTEIARMESMLGALTDPGGAR